MSNKPKKYKRLSKLIGKDKRSAELAKQKRIADNVILYNARKTNGHLIDMFSPFMV